MCVCILKMCIHIYIYNIYIHIFVCIHICRVQGFCFRFRVQRRPRELRNKRIQMIISQSDVFVLIGGLHYP